MDFSHPRRQKGRVQRTWERSDKNNRVQKMKRISSSIGENKSTPSVFGGRESLQVREKRLVPVREGKEKSRSA